MSISMRVSEQEKKLIQEFADHYGVSISEFIRLAVMERIEDEYDLKCYEQAKAEYEKDPKTYTFDEVNKMLGIEIDV